MAFLSPEPVTIYLSSVEMSQLSTDDVSFDCKTKRKDFINFILPVSQLHYDVGRSNEEFDPSGSLLLKESLLQRMQIRVKDVESELHIQ